MKYTVGKSHDQDQLEPFVSNDARVATKLIDILFDYIDKRIIYENSITAKYIWKILSSGTHHVKNWVNKNDVDILLDKFEEELKKRKK